MEIFVKIEIKTEHYNKLQERVSYSQTFRSVSEYINYVIDLLLDEKNQDIEQMSKEEERQIHKRLKDLGYV